MSAIAAWERPLTASSPVVIPLRRPQRLRVAAGGAKPLTPPRGVGVPLRMTRRGRLAVTLVVFAAVAFAALGWWERLGAPASRPAHTIVVGVGQSLPEIALRELPAMTAPDAIARIRFANQLNSTDVRPGQRLVVPAVP